MNEQIYMNEISTSHERRMLHVAKYLPFFKLWSSDLSQFKDGRYAVVDIPYVTMAVLRYFIEENSFNDRPVTYEMYSLFMKELLQQDFNLALPSQEMAELNAYIFDKLCNEGKPFTADWYDPVEKKKKTIRMRLFESKFAEDAIVYSLSAEALEFYLDTKEIKDESRISIDQVLLEKMVRSKNFEGGLQVIARINQEVSGLIAKKDSIVSLFGRNVFEGAKALEDFLNHGMRWFEEEQKLFQKNKVLVDQAMRMEGGQVSFKEIAAIDTELKRAMKKHGDLIAACTELQVQADELITKARRSRFRRSTDFAHLKEVMLTHDHMEALPELMAPLLGLRIKPHLNFELLDQLLDNRVNEKQNTETIEKGQEEIYVYEDEAVNTRIENNFRYLLKVLFEQIQEKNSLDLRYLSHLYMMKFGEEIYRNGDLYSFFVHLSQKDYYDLKDIKVHQDTFLEGIIADYLSEDGEIYDHLKFALIYQQDESISPLGLFEMTNIRFERK